MISKTKIDGRLKKIRAAAQHLRGAPSARKNAVLNDAARLLLEKSGAILKANAKDLAGLERSATAAFRDRLTLNRDRLALMAESLRQVAALPDPIAEAPEKKVLANGLRVQRVRAPLGVIFMVFESRPNVATEAFSLAFKAANAVILRGGRESMKTTAVLYAVLEEALVKNGFPPDALWGITDPDRNAVKTLLRRNDAIDVVVPRGGERFIAFVCENTSIPVIKNDRGMCHVYVDAQADLPMAERIAVNSKTHRPGVCNAMETLLVHQAAAEAFLPRLFDAMVPHKLQWFACPKTARLLGKRPGVAKASKKSWDTEYLDLKMNCRVVASLEEAIAHIEAHGSRHSESIVTRDAAAAKEFQSRIDAAAVYWNASTRFTDGFELGLGGELGISTQKLHVRGPVGLRELTSLRWVIEGDGQVRA